MGEDWSRESKMQRYVDKNKLVFWKKNRAYIYLAFTM